MCSQRSQKTGEEFARCIIMFRRRRAVDEVGHVARAQHRALEQRRALGHLRERALDEVQIAAEPVVGMAIKQ